MSGVIDLHQFSKPGRNFLAKICWGGNLFGFYCCHRHTDITSSGLIIGLVSFTFGHHLHSCTLDTTKGSACSRVVEG